MTHSAYVQVDVQDSVATVTLNRPERLNALGASMREDLLAALQAIAATPEARAVVLTGAGRAFCAGGDVKEMNERKQEGGAARSWNEELRPARDQVLTLLRQMPQPVLAGINGPATGAGMNLALACDLRIASDEATFGQVFVKRGLHPDWGGTFFLPRLVGPAKAMELILGGDLFGAEEALGMGLINRMVPHAELEQATAQWAAELAAGPPVAMALAKRSVYRNMEGDLPGALETETYAQRMCWDTEDATEGIQAFVEKRSPQFRGR